MLVIVLCGCGTLIQTQKSQSSTPDTDDIFVFADDFSRVNFSVQDAVKCFGTINENNRNDWAFPLTPFPSERERVKEVILETFDEQRKLDAVRIEYIKPVLISYGKLKEKYGAPSLQRLPKILCAPGKIDCPPAFVGYRFKFVPDRKNSASGKSLDVSIDLDMKWSKEIPKPSDKDFLEVKAIRFKRVWNGELGMKQNSN